jgi:ubiquinone/menaquinone biosynthesis C-methylase UbiE
LLKTIYALDGSANMLNNAFAAENIFYTKIDINRDLFISPKKVDFIGIGRAIRWINSDSLINLADKNLKPGGSIIILKTVEIKNTTWHPILDSLTKKYKRHYLKTQTPESEKEKNPNPDPESCDTCNITNLSIL